MKYRQWKKNYKKKHGVNPPLELDKRKQRRLARKMARQINKTLPTAAERNGNKERENQRTEDKDRKDQT